MIRYEILSNVASSEHGLQTHPALLDLEGTLGARGLEVRFIRQVFRAEEEINLASAKHARGVRVRGTAVRQVPPESTLKGCLAWLRAVVFRVERGLHVEVENLRATNGAPLVIAQVLARKQVAFVSGLDEAGWARLTAQADPACKAVPAAIADSGPLRLDYLSRARRPAGFMALLGRLCELKVLAPEQLAVLREIVAARDAGRLAGLSEAQVINLALIHESLERYEKILEQLVMGLATEPVLGELAGQFDLITQGIPCPRLQEALLPFTLEEKRDRIRDRRGLVNEVRIGLQRSAEAQRDVLFKVLVSLVLPYRLRQDPLLYRRAVHLPPMETARVEALVPLRRLFLGWEGTLPAAANPGPDPAGRVPVAATQGLFELAVTLALQARLGEKAKESQLPTPVALARQLLGGMRFERFEMASLPPLNPQMPVKGVARSLAEKVPLGQAELDDIRRSLREALFPLDAVAAPLASELQTRLRDQRTQRKMREVEAFLLGSTPLLSTTNYVLGRSGQTPLVRRAILGAGRCLGLVMLESRDQIRRRDVLEQLHREGGETVGGYQLLMNRDDAAFFPLQAAPAHLSRAYRHLVGERAVSLVRDLVSTKLKYLFDTHGDRLFDVIYDHLTWTHRLQLSRGQLGHLLLLGKVFDKVRLAEFGFSDQPEGRLRENENPWLPGEGPDESLVDGLAPDRLEAAYTSALAAFSDLVRAYPAGKGTEATDGQPLTIQEALGALAQEEAYDLSSRRVRGMLAATREAAQLTEGLQGLLARQPDLFKTSVNSEEEQELLLPGPLAYLTLLREHHPLTQGERPARVRLVPGRHLDARHLGPATRALAGQLSELLGKGGTAAPLRQALEILQRHETAWGALLQVSMALLIDQILRETVLRLVRPQPPLPGELLRTPEDKVLCLAPSSFDQPKFHRVVAHPERRDLFATLSELASWLLRFRRLREELEGHRGLIADIVAVIEGFNLSTFEAPHINHYAEELARLDDLLDVRPEEITGENLAAIEQQAREVGRTVRTIFEQERSLRMRDRWMSRITIRLRAMRPNARLTFVDRLHEQGQAPEPPATGEDEPAADKRREKEFQTFSERVRNVIEVRERLENKEVFVLSPSNTQRQLTLMLLEQLYRLKGVNAAIFADISGCESFLDVLRTRIPPHRLFDLNAL